jgi:hypothetical protein
MKKPFSVLKFSQPMILAIRLVFVLSFLLPGSRAFAEDKPHVMTQEEVFKSISENVSDSGGVSGKTMTAFLAGFVGLILIIALYSVREKRQADPRPVNHHGKLIKEMCKKFSIRRGELKQLKILADAEKEAGVPIDSPLVFLICPSTLANAMRADRVRVDRKVIAGLARKLGIIS